MKYIKWTEKKLEQFFEDNFIEDDELYEMLKGREAVLKMDTNPKAKRNETELTIIMRMTND
jgi:hypothetical protein